MYAEEENGEVTLQKSGLSFSSSDSSIAFLKPFVSCKLFFVKSLGNLLSDLVFSTQCFTELKACIFHFACSSLNSFFFMSSDLLVFLPSFPCMFSCLPLLQFCISLYF